LLQPSVEGEAAAPPASPEDGECWLVAAGASGDFAGRDGQLASRQAGGWLFAAPRDGMRVFDRAAGQFAIYAGGWSREPGILEPAGGSTVDTEARVAIGQLIAALSRSGIFPAI